MIIILIEYVVVVGVVEVAQLIIFFVPETILLDDGRKKRWVIVKSGFAIQGWNRQGRHGIPDILYFACPSRSCPRPFCFFCSRACTWPLSGCRFWWNQLHMSSINAARSQRLAQPNSGRQMEFIAFGACLCPSERGRLDIGAFALLFVCSYPARLSPFCPFLHSNPVYT